MKTFSQSDQSVVQSLERMINHLEEASLYRKTVSWDTLRANALQMAANAANIKDLQPACNYLLCSLGDEHGRVIYNNQILAYYYSGQIKEHQKTFQPDIYNKIQSGQYYFFRGELLSNNIGYIRIVGLPMGDNAQMAKEIESTVCQLSAAGAVKWIIDLRYNGGGNMHPMAEGIATIIGDGSVGGSVGLEDSDHSNWKIENGHFYYDDYSIELPEICSVSPNAKLAVLTSVYTASSGEAVAIMCKGRDNTRFFGQKTLGMVTVTDWFVVDEATAMTISVSYYRDRNDVVYTEFVGVDAEFPFEENPLSDSDACLKAAVNWLSE
jgi:carboxyl-terminal processing protease